MNVTFAAYSRILLNYKCQIYDDSGKRGAPKTKLLSVSPKYNLELKSKPND